MVGWFDAEKGNTLRYEGFKQMVINKLDALTLDRPKAMKILKFVWLIKLKMERS